MESDRMQFEISVLPAPIERALEASHKVVEAAQWLGRFLTPQQTEMCLSNHIRHELADGEPAQAQLPFAVEEA